MDKNKTVIFTRQSSETIRFKSTPDNWFKEYHGLKSNTVRKFDDINDPRLKIIKDFIAGKIDNLYIEIQNTDTLQIFQRNCSDGTEYDGYYIISWRG